MKTLAFSVLAVTAIGLWCWIAALQIHLWTHGCIR